MGVRLHIVRQRSPLCVTHAVNKEPRLYAKYRRTSLQRPRRCTDAHTIRRRRRQHASVQTTLRNLRKSRRKEPLLVLRIMLSGYSRLKNSKSIYLRRGMLSEASHCRRLPVTAKRTACRHWVPLSIHQNTTVTTEDHKMVFMPTYCILFFLLLISCSNASKYSEWNFRAPTINFSICSHCPNKFSINLLTIFGEVP